MPFGTGLGRDHMPSPTILHFLALVLIVSNKILTYKCKTQDFFSYYNFDDRTASISQPTYILYCV